MLPRLITAVLLLLALAAPPLSLGLPAPPVDATRLSAGVFLVAKPEMP